MTKIKICGLMRLADIEAVNRARPDYIGFVFAKSRRQINLETAKTLKGALDPRIKAVGVFVNQPLGQILDLVNQGVIDLIQLHGDEDEQTIGHLKKESNCPIIKAMAIKNRTDIKKTKAHYWLFDAYHPQLYGGLGKSFNWDLLKGLEEDFFLAGGLNRDNIKEAIDRVNPYCLDISSGVESGGKKDGAKIIQLIEKIRRINK